MADISLPVPTLPTYADVEDAARRLAGVAHRTPVHTSRTLDKRLSALLFLKAESFQRAGALVTIGVTGFQMSYQHAAATYQHLHQQIGNCG